MRLTKDIFIERCLEKHGDNYDYSKVEYYKIKSHVLIKCKKHDFEFYQTPGKHLESKTGGCNKCNSIGKGAMNNALFIEKSNLKHNSKYNYEFTRYEKSNSKVKIVCYTHGVFEITPNSHLNGRGCQKCGGNAKYEKEDLLRIFNLLYNNKYQYDFKDYSNIKSKIVVKCDKHSYFESTGELLINGYGCSSCGKVSIGEEKVSKYLIDSNISYQKQKSFDGCVYHNKMQFDFFIPSKNVCIEYDGVQHFKPIDYFGGEESLKLQKDKDVIKNNFCRENNIKLIRIPYYSYRDIEKILEKEL